MNPFADDIEAAKEVIAEDGCEAVWFQPAPDDENVKPWREGEGDPVEFPVRVAIFSPKELGYGAGNFGSMIDGTEIPTSAEILLMAGGQDFEPALTDWVVLPSGHAEIVKLDRLAPNDIAILWYVWIKR